MSVLAMLLCVTMLVGTTFAWFTDSVTSSGNIIKSGTLKVGMYWAEGQNDVPTEDKDWNDAADANKGAIFDYANWEPGFVMARHIKIANEGSLALKYQVNIIVNGKVSELADVIDVYYADPAVVATRGLNGMVRLGTLTEVLADMGETAKGVLLAGNNDTITLALKMQESAGNEYQDMSIGSSFDIQLLATQFTYESDSFDENYDEDAVVGDLVVADENSDLIAILANAKKDQPLTIILEGDVTLPTAGSAGGAKDVTPASSVVIDGKGKYTLTATGSGVTPIGDSEAVFTFRDLTVADESVSYNEAAWEFSYLELGNVVCENVVFADPIMVEGQNASFNNCTFNGVNDTANGITMNGVWVANGDSTFTHCTFQNNRGMKICDRYAPEVGTVVIDGCTFQNLEQKPGVAIDDWETRDMKITIKNSTFINCQPGDQGLYVYETDNTVPTVENNIVESYTELVEIATKEQLVAFANRVNGGDGMSKVMVKLTDNIDLAGMEWTPIGQTGTSYGATNYFQGIFDGQGYTISNMTITQTNDGKHYAAGFFGFIDAADVTIRNVNFDKANVKGHHWTGVVAGYLTGNIEKCNVTNSTVLCTHANDDACGDKAGLIVGYVNNGLVNNCTASDSTVTAGRDAGQIAGASKTDYVANCTATNVTVTANGDCTGANVNNAVIGRVL